MLKTSCWLLYLWRVLEQFLNHNRRHQLFNEQSRVVVAVSGGIDSMVMVQLFRETGIPIGVAHANFRLRGNESDGDEQFVRSYCEQHALPFFSRRFDTAVYAQQNGLSIQMAARELRYAWFEELLESANYDLVATAHHLNDSFETILLNWVNGSSLNGLCGIPVKNGKIIRPLLFATRSDIEKYAKEKMIAWREDSSNSTSDYQRNFIRHNIMPLLHELNPSLEQTLQRGLDKLAGEKDLQDWAFEKWAKGYAEHFDDKIIIKKEAFDQFPSGGASILFRLINHLGFNYDVCVSAINALHGQAGKRFIGAAHDLVIDRDALILFPKADIWKEVTIQKGQPKALLGSWAMEVLEEGQLVMDTKWQAFFDADKIKFPLVWRLWKPGDVFYPLGMDHRKKVSDLLIDEKVSLADKSRVTVLESGGQVIWVVGHRIDNRFKITSDTRQTMQFTVSPYFG
ncbi:MAG: tRNA lysidine(34) synthetase TilS [Cyclobacteriaceae bacterium]|nr:tRNA lysidine(34) synthetase TilS [Cyclobacteriaceae bacterium]UYN88081.1 MAG: tRNA lysidine(34) synthetase TilS [Cyclobacteriaceae bacterium]